MQQKITEKQGIYIFIFFCLGANLITGVSKASKEDAWLSIILAAVLCLPMYWVFVQLSISYRGENIYEIFNLVLGKYIGAIFCVIYIGNEIYLLALSLRISAEFICMTSLNETPIMIVMVFLGLSIGYMLKNNIAVFGRWCQFFIFFVVLMVVFEMIFVTPIRKVDNIYPVLFNGIEPVLKGTIEILAFSVAQASILISLFKHLTKEASVKKIYYFGLISVTVILLILTIDNITVLGASRLSQAYFPSYNTFRLITIGRFIQKSEIIFIYGAIIASYARSCALMFSSLMGMKVIFKLENYKKLILPITALCVVLAHYVYKNLIQREAIFNKIILPQILVINLGIPVLVFGIHLCKKLWKNRGGNKDKRVDEKMDE